MTQIVKNYCEFPSMVRRPMWKIWHKLLIRFDKGIDVHFMNYGYQSLNGEPPLRLNEEDEPGRYCIQLYDQVIKGAEIENKNVLEVGSGRGGGASYIARYYRPETYTGIDISADLINFCNSYFKVKGLSFLKGRAEKLPFENKLFDVIVNVESARCYSDLSMFFREAFRVLKPDGYFMFADMIQDGEVDEIKSKLINCGFRIDKEREITKNVVKALDLDTNRREMLIKKRIPWPLKSSFAQFAGTKGTGRYEEFASGKYKYWTYILRKA